MKRWLRIGGELVLAAALAFFAASAITWPAVLHLDEVIIGGGELGGWLWRYWWHFTEVDALAAGDLGPIETVKTFLSLGRHPETGNILDVLLISWPLAQLTELPGHYNLKVFLILIGDGVLGYALARQLTRSKSAALAASLVAVVNPLNLQDIHGSGLRQVVLWFLLLFPIALDRAERLKKPLAGFLAGVCLGLCGAWYWFYGLFAGMYLGIWCLDLLRSPRLRWEWRRHLNWLLPLIAGVVLVGGLFALPYALGEGGGQLGAQSKLPELSFFLTFPEYDVIRDVPLRPSTYEENVLSSLNRTIMSSWSVDYLFNPAHSRGLPLVVFVFGVLPAALLSTSVQPRARFWLVVFTVFWLGTLGPFLKIGGDVDSSEVVLIGDYVVRLPYTWMFKWIPGMSRMFAPYRMGSMVVVASVALVAMGLSRLPAGWIRRSVAGLTMAATLLQVSYRWEVGPVPDDAEQPSMWRAPLKVSAIRVPDFYQELPEDRAGLIELPLEQQQDLLYYYQLEHHWKVYRSWATRPAIPPPFRDAGGGDAGELLRYLAQADAESPGVREGLMALSRTPADAELSGLEDAAFERLVVAGNYRYVVVHERGYYLVDPQRGALLYNAAVTRLEQALGIAPEESVEMAWFDYPGNEYTVPDGPIYVPWSSQEVNLPDREMPTRYFMAVFDLGPIHDGWEGPIPTVQGASGPLTGPEHEEIEHTTAPPGAPQ